MSFASQHFTLEELCRSQTALRLGIDNTAPPEVRFNLARLCCDLLDAIRAHFGPVHVDSGYRCPALNQAIGGAQTSAHLDGSAADILVPGVPVLEVTRWIAFESGLPYDQVIYEYDSWTHVATARVGQAPRHQALRTNRESPTGYDLFDLAFVRKMTSSGEAP